MAGNLESVLASIPGYGGFLAKKQFNENREQQDLEQAVKAQGILSALQQQQMLSGANMNDPDTLRKLGMALKKPEFITHAERIEKQRNDGATLATMQSRPGVQPDLQEVAQAAAPVATPQGGLFGTLSQSEIPSIAAQARMLQARMDQADARSVSPQHWVDMQKELAGQETKYLETRANKTEKPEPAIQTHTDGDGRLWERDRGGSWKLAVGPDGKQITSKMPAEKADKPLPASAAQKVLENQQNLRRAEQALALAEGKNLGAAKGDTAATGWKGFVPDTLLQRVDPGGVDTRAAIADLGSLVIHDRSGAAVTAAEFPRLKPFIPTFTDDAETVKKKLARFVQTYRDIVGEQTDFYRESGYKVPSETLRPGVPTAPTPAPAPGKPRLKFDAQGNPVK